MPRIHILGAPGSGASTLGAMVASELAVRHFETDDFFWAPTDPPFTTPRPKSDRLALMMEALAATPDWVLSGSTLRWGQPIAPLFDLIVYLSLHPVIRMQRLRARERARYGCRIEPGGDMAQSNAAFLEWAAAYDTAGPEQRSRTSHEAWLATWTSPVLRLDSAASQKSLADAILSFIRAHTPRVYRLHDALYSPVGKSDTPGRCALPWPC